MYINWKKQRLFIKRNPQKIVDQPEHWKRRLFPQSPFFYTWLNSFSFNFTDWNCHAVTSLICDLHFIWTDQLPCDASLFESCVNPWLDPFVSDLLVFCYCLCCFNYHVWDLPFSNYSITFLLSNTYLDISVLIHELLDVPSTLLMALNCS